MVGPGSWHMIHIGGEATDVQVRDLSLNAAELAKAEDTHLIVVGTSNSIPGGARHVSIVTARWSARPVMPWQLCRGRATSRARKSPTSPSLAAGC